MLFSNPDFLTGIAFTLSVATLLVFLELRRNSRRKLSRILASLVLLAAVFMIYAKPIYKTTTKGKNLIVLTEGYDQTALDSLKSFLEEAQVVQWDSVAHTAIRDYNIYLLGSGVPLYDLQKLSSNHVIPVLKYNSAGFQRISYTNKLYQDEELRVSGTYHNTNGDSLYMKLSLNNYVLDSTMIYPAPGQSFELSAVGSTVGRFEYLLEIERSSSPVAAEILPVEIEGRPKYKVLVLNAFPSFEMRYLKNFIAREGHELVVRSQISRNLFSYDRYNTSLTQPIRVDQKTFENFDVLVLDLESLRLMNNSEKRALENAVLRGLGVFILPEANLFNTKSRFLPGFERMDKEQITINIQGKYLGLSSFSYQIKRAVDNEEIILNQSTVGFQKYLGKGKIAGSYLKSTYPLQLRGDSIVYKRIWRSFVDELVHVEDQVAYQHNQMAIVNHPLPVKISSIHDLKAKYNNEDIGIQEDLIEGVSSTIIWPGKVGWNYLDVIGDGFSERYWFYVFSADQWVSVRSFERQLYNSERLSEENKWEERPKEITKEVNSLWFYLTILFCVGYLWVEPKL